MNALCFLSSSLKMSITYDTFFLKLHRMSFLKLYFHILLVSSGISWDPVAILRYNLFALLEDLIILQGDYLLT